MIEKDTRHQPLASTAHVDPHTGEHAHTCEHTSLTHTLVKNNQVESQLRKSLVSHREKKREGEREEKDKNVLHKWKNVDFSSYLSEDSSE